MSKASSHETLGQIVHKGADAWLQLTPRKLGIALGASGKRGGVDLYLFWQQVEQRRASLRADKGVSDDERRRYYEWTERVSASFAEQLTPQTVGNFVASLPTTEEQVVFLGLLHRHRWAYSKLNNAIDQLTGRFVSEVPPKSPSSDEANLHHVQLALALVDVVGMINGAEAALALVLRSIPTWLFQQLIKAIGQLQSYENYASKFQDALLDMDGTIVGTAIAVAFASDRPWRLGDLLKSMTLLRDDASFDDKSPRRATNLRQILAITKDKLREIEPSLHLRVSTFGKFRERHKTDLVALLASYLNRAPSNHEDVFDAISIREGISMKRSSIHVPHAVEFRDKLDFDGSASLLQLKPTIATQMILEQELPEFTLAYLGMIIRSGNKHTRSICQQLTEDAGFVSRLMAASGTMAVLVLDNLHNLRSKDESIAELYGVALTTLLPKVPFSYLSHRFHWVRSDTHIDFKDVCCPTKERSLILMMSVALLTHFIIGATSRTAKLNPHSVA